ncbi:MAG: NAD(P)/FAD-dependent oxidoreductase [Maricaulaceae bacterium]
MSKPPEVVDCLILGAGAAGLFCAAEAARRGRSVAVLDHARKLGEKIRISGGGRCNFTNLNTAPEHFLSQNPKFCISALNSYTPTDFLNKVESAGIAWVEKARGQLFCQDSAQQIIDLLLDDCRRTGADVRAGQTISNVSQSVDGFRVETSAGTFTTRALVVATGGKSIPKIGATGFGYQLADRFGLTVIDPRPALVPLTFEGAIKTLAEDLAGVSLDATVTAATPAKARKAKPPAFRDGVLFTHRGLSGPAILQSSSYWREGADILVDFAPDGGLYEALLDARARLGRSAIQTGLGEVLPKRLAQALCAFEGWEGRLADWSNAKLQALVERLRAWRVTPAGSEGYRTAEVTLGGVDTAGLNSKTLEAKAVPGLFFIGEVVDVTGWLGGYNFQWAWASAYAAARAVAKAPARAPG